MNKDHRGQPVKQQRLTEEVDQEEAKGLEVIDVSQYKPKKIPPPLWRECIRKTWEADPQICPHCRFEMKIISFITARDGSVELMPSLREQFSKFPSVKYTSNKRGQSKLKTCRIQPIYLRWPEYEPSRPFA